MALIGYDSQKSARYCYCCNRPKPGHTAIISSTRAADGSRPLCGTRCSAPVRARLSCSGIAAARPTSGCGMGAWPSPPGSTRCMYGLPYSQTKSWMRWPRSVRSVERLRDVRRLAWRARWRDRRARSACTRAPDATRTERRVRVCVGILFCHLCGRVADPSTWRFGSRRSRRTLWRHFQSAPSSSIATHTRMAAQRRGRSSMQTTCVMVGSTGAMGCISTR